MYSQGVDDVIYECNFGLKKNVFMIAVCLSKTKKNLLMENVDDFIYGKSAQIKLHKHYQKFLSPEAYNVKDIGSLARIGRMRTRNLPKWG